jgi:diadenosine tetraphosphate (Ap4A) HIT family hydrolase
LPAFGDHHPESLEDLDEFERDMLMADVVEVARAIETVTRCRRVNYAALCNAVNHVHFHLIPRFDDKENDPLPERSPWNNPNPAKPLEPWYRNGLIWMLDYALRDGEAYEYYE